MIRLLVGGQDNKVDLDQVIKEVVRDCQTFLKDNTLQPSPLSKKHKKIAKGLQNNVLELSYSSKRLKEVTKGSQTVPQDKALLNCLAIRVKANVYRQ